MQWPGGGGGGRVLPLCMHIGYVPRERPPPFRSISFSQITKKSVPEHHHFTFFGGFCRSGDHHVQNFFNLIPFIASHGRSVRRSGDTQYHAQNGSSSFRSPAFSSSFRSPTFSRSTGSPFRSPFFTLPRHIPTKIWGEYLLRVQWISVNVTLKK